MLHKICFAGPSEAVKQVWVKLTPPPPPAVEGKTPPVWERAKFYCPTLREVYPQQNLVKFFLNLIEIFEHQCQTILICEYFSLIDQ